MLMVTDSVPVDRKMLLTIPEAASYSNIGINRLNGMLLEEGCPFVLFVGRKKLVMRKAFEEYILDRFAV